MHRVGITVYFLVVLSLAFGVIWPDYAPAQTPRLELLGEITAGLRVPTRLAVDSSGNLFVGDSRNQAVVMYDPYGQIRKVFTIPGMTGDGLAVAHDGSKIYVSAKDQVLSLQVSDLQAGALGRGLNEFILSGFIAVDTQGYVYVADLGAKLVKIYTPEGSFHNSLVGPFKTISSLAIATQFDDDVSNDEIFVTDSFVSSNSSPKLYVFNSAGSLLRTLSAKDDFSSPIRIFGKPAFDHANRYYIGDVEQNRLHVMELANSPALAGVPLVSPLGNSGDLINPIDLAFDDNTNRLFVLYGDRCVRVYGVDGGQNLVKTNSAPSVPSPIEPIAGSEATSDRPTLKFKNAIDTDHGDVVSYTVQLFDQSEQLIASYRVAEQPGMTTVSVELDLHENQRYFWKVQATDGDKVSSWTDLQTFYFNAVQEAPEVPRLVSPLAAAVVNSDGLLTWRGSTDNDPGDEVSYEVVIATDAELTDQIYSERLSATDVAMSEWSPVLKPGQEYFWKVTAVDNHGLTSQSTEDGRFTFRSTMLSVTATMLGAKVYLGGNIAYAGQYMGITPLELRDLPAGRYQVVVERAGFEPFMQSVEVRADQASQVYAQLKPALQAGTLNFKEIKVDSNNVHFDEQSAPLLVDLDLDGIEDLLLATADGVLHYHPGTLTNAAEYRLGRATKRKVVFTAEQELSLPQVPGASPCLVDWNNDWQPDLLIGGADGSVRLFLNHGAMTFAADGILLATVSGAAVPAVIDIDADGDKDLVIGSDNGELVLLMNQGTDAAPQLTDPQLLIAFAEAAAPYFADWDGNGQRELLVVVAGQIFRTAYVDAKLQKLSLVETGKAAVTSINVFNFDGRKGVDLLAGTADGKLLLARNNATKVVDAFYSALSEKLSALQRLVAGKDPVQLPLIEKMVLTLEQKSLPGVMALAEELRLQLPADSMAALEVIEIIETLQNVPLESDKDAEQDDDERDVGEHNTQTETADTSARELPEELDLQPPADSMAALEATEIIETQQNVPLESGKDAEQEENENEVGELNNQIETADTSALELPEELDLQPPADSMAALEATEIIETKQNEPLESDKNVVQDEDDGKYEDEDKDEDKDGEINNKMKKMTTDKDQVESL